MNRLTVVTAVFFLLTLSPCLYGQEPSQKTPTAETADAKIVNTGKDISDPKKSKLSLIPEINKRKVKVGEPVEFKLTLKWRGTGDDYQFRMPIVKTKNLSIKKISQSSETETDAKGQTNLRIYKYKLVPPKGGETIIESFSIEYHQKGIEQTFLLDVPAFYIDVQSPPFDWRFLVIIIVTLTICATVVILIFVMRRRSRKKPPVSTQIPPETKALNAIESAEIFLKEREIETFMKKIEAILRDFLYAKYGLTINMRSKEELVASLKKEERLQKEDAQLLGALLTKFQEVRFGGIIPNYNEASTIKKRVHDFIAGKKISEA